MLIRNLSNPSTAVALKPSLIIFAGLTLLALATCGKDIPTKPSPPPPPPQPPVQPVPTSISITPASVTLMAIGQTRKLEAAVVDQNGQPLTSANVLWSSSNSIVATVSPQGLVTAVGNGTAQITATAGNASASVPVTVAQTPGRIVIEPMTATLMAIGDTVQITATVLDQNGQLVAGAVVTWQSSDESVATVTPEGLVTAVGNGTAQITATAGNASATATVQVKDTRRDREALIALYHSTNGPNWHNRTNWLSDEPLDTWHGVVTSTQGEVTAVYLNRDNLRGPIPPEIGQLQNLTTLNLRSNQLTGPIPPEIGQLQNLTTLDLRFNQLTGPIPPEIGQLQNLTTLDLRENQLTGPIPPEIGQLQNLTTLVLSGNQLTGSIPPEIGQLQNLTTLNLHSNQLTGSIPPEIGQLQNLTTLVLPGNQLTGSIPPEIGQLQNLISLGLPYNQLTGAIPPEIGQLQNLTVLDLANNLLTGLIPPHLGKLRKLEHLGLYQNNGLYGQLPDEITMLTQLKRFWLSFTQVCVPPTTEFKIWLDGIPDKYGIFTCENPDRDALYALYNSTDGSNWTTNTNWVSDAPLNDWYGVTTSTEGKVTKIELEGNNLNGALPGQLGDLTDLRTLNLSFNNALSGAMPVSYTRLNLEELMLDETMVCAPPDSQFRSWLNAIPRISVGNCTDFRREYYILAEFYNSTNGLEWFNDTNWLSDEPLNTWYGITTNVDGEVVNLVLQGNNLQGQIPPELEQLHNLKVLNLESNRMTGPIPPELGQLRNLEELRISANRLTRPIPPELGQLQNLVVLELSYNGLFGPIPSELGQLHNLENLRIVHNHMPGPIPKEFGQLENLNALDLEENQLSGPIPPELGMLRDLTRLGLSENQLAGAIPSELGMLQNLRILDLEQNHLTGPIPPELGMLRDLTHLELSGNQLAGAIPPELGMLQDLFHLRLHHNQLIGHIPIELEQLNKLAELSLSFNQLMGNIPQSLGNLISLKSLSLTGNGSMTGILPDELTKLHLDELLLGGTQLCAAQDPGFQDWLRSIPSSRVGQCDANLGGSVVYLTQATQSLDYPVPLVAGEDALLRVFVTTESSIDVSMPNVRATFYVDGYEVYNVEMPSQGTTIPHNIIEGDLSATANARLPGSVVQPGLEMVVNFDPEDDFDQGLGTATRLPPDGRLVVDVRDVPPFELTMIPFLWTENPDRSILSQVESLTPGSDLLRFTRDLLPVADFVLNVHEPVWTSEEPVFGNSNAILRETTAIGTMDGAGGHYMGIILDEGGRAFKPGTMSVASLQGNIIAHELGHNMGLFHAPCSAGLPDPDFPYANGSIGAWGYDLVEDILVSPSTGDLMGYCEPQWISDYHFTKAMVYRLSKAQETPLAAAFAPSTRSLLLWGGLDSDGELVLEPAFVVDAPPSIPRSNGPYQITGEDQDGRTLFRLSFGMPEVADAEAKAFAFILPVQGIGAAAWIGSRLQDPRALRRWVVKKARKKRSSLPPRSCWTRLLERCGAC